MPTTLAAPAPGPQPRTRWTVTQFNRMGDMGWFEGRRAFLLDGVILENGPMDPLHAVALGLVQQFLIRSFGAGWWVRCQSPFHVDEFNDPLPDFAVVSGEPEDYLDIHPAVAALVVEIADSSLTYDLGEKAERYATAGVPDYWVLDLEGRVLHVMRDPIPLPAGLGATAYRDQRVLTTADSASPLAAPTAVVPVARLFPREGADMPATLTPPGSPVPQTLFTVAEFHELRSLPRFTGRRLFLIDGVIREQGPMNAPHANGVVFVTEALRTAFGAGYVVRGQLPLPVGTRTDPFPDVAVVRGEVRDFPAHPTTAELVVEVADTTLNTDLSEKAEKYATAGIAEYWVLDVVSRELHVLRDPGSLAAALGAIAYRRHTTLGPNDSVAPLAAPSAAILVADMLP